MGQETAASLQNGYVVLRLKAKQNMRMERGGIWTPNPTTLRLL